VEAFAYRDGELYAEDVPVGRLCEEHGTPLYIYSRAAAVAAFRAMDEVFADLDHLTCYSVKSNANLAVLRALAASGAGADVVSGGELFRALRAGIDPRRTVFAGVGKTRQEIGDALDAGILLFNVESMPEAHAIESVAASRHTRAPVALRVNPDVDPDTHEHITTGKKGTKFGMDLGRAVEHFKEAATLPHLDVRGVHAHIGSQITDVEPFRAAMELLVQLVEALRNNGLTIEFLNIGGGLGIAYRDETPVEPAAYAAAIRPLARACGCRLILEPGRFVTGNAGILCATALYRKETDSKRFLIVDAAMNDLVRPALYDSWHRILPVRESGRDVEVVDVVGPVCEAGDFLAKEREIPRVEEGELVAVFSAGAYGFVMASNYNARPRAAEVLVAGERAHLVRRRETYEDLVRGEVIPEGLW
jgi:diaminopimelate decarboxylase